ncbi:hypothetical protein [Endozoicomonas atrinae]|uniref:hypothetical protein n=1 Tax=Endozoicomonas atrinae TaxID=1333660 RepID=UPI003AFFE265
MAHGLGKKALRLPDRYGRAGCSVGRNRRKRPASLIRVLALAQRGYLLAAAASGSEQDTSTESSISEVTLQEVEVADESLAGDSMPVD